MKNRSKKWLLTLLLVGSVALLATGCDKLKKEPQTEAPTETEPVTEAPTEAPTETEPVTEAPTEPPTETEPVTEAPTEPRVLTKEEEVAEEKDFDQLRSMYAVDDINIRTEPSSADGANIFSSFMQGDKVVVVGETPNWYKVDVEGYDFYGYVSKQFVSEQEVAAKTDEERQEAIEKELGAATAGETAPADSNAAANTTTSVDTEYGVGAYAESFPIVAATGANLRKTPSQDGEIVATIGSGTSVTALGETDRWYKVDFNGTVGYVNKNLFNAD